MTPKLWKKKNHIDVRTQHEKGKRGTREKEIQHAFGKKALVDGKKKKGIPPLLNC